MRTHAPTQAAVAVSLAVFVAACGGGATSGEDAGSGRTDGGGVVESLQLSAEKTSVSVDESKTASFAVTVGGNIKGAPPLPKLRSPPAFATITGNVVTLAPTYEDAGKYTLVLEAKDEAGAVGYVTVIVTVNDVKRDPVFPDIAPISVDEGETETVALSAYDPDGEAISYDLSGEPAFVSIGASGTSLVIAPGYSDHQPTAYLFSLTATNQSGKTTLPKGVQVTVVNKNRPPVISPVTFMGITDGGVYEGNQMSALVTVNDPDTNDTVNNIDFVGGAKPAFVTLTGTTPGVRTLTVDVTGDFTAGDPVFKDYSFELIASDNLGAEATAVPVSIRVYNANAKPRFDATAYAPMTASELTPADRQLTATDLDPNETASLTISLGAGAPAWASINSGLLRVTPPADVATRASSPVTVNIPIVVTDVNGAFEARSIPLSVSNTNRAPTFTPVSNVTLSELQSQNVTLVATDPDAETVTLAAVGTLPGWVTFTASTGVVSLAPQTGDNGTVTLNFTASDGLDTANTSFTVTVGVTNTPPSFVGAPRQISTTTSTDLPGGSSVFAAPILRAAYSDAQGDQVKLEVEVVPQAQAFTNTPTFVGSLSSSGTAEFALQSLAANVSYKWQARLRDEQNLASAWTAFASVPAFTIQPQALSGSIVINGTNATTTSATVTLTLAITPGNGASSITDIAFSQDGTNFGATQAYSTTVTNFALTGGDGTRTVFVKAHDNLANEAVFSDSIILDTSNPTVSAFTLAAGKQATQSSTVLLSYTVSDTPTGVATVEASNDGTNFTAVTSGSNWPLTAGDGLKTVTLRVTDGAGNSTTDTEQIRVDNVVPTISSFQVNAGAAFTNSLNVTVATSATDDSGLPLSEICLQNLGGSTACQPYSASLAHALAAGPDEARTVLVIVKDAAGNQANSGDAITLDRAVPVISQLNLASGALYTSTPAITATSVQSDSPNSVKEIAFSYNAGTSWTPYEPVGAGYSLTLPSTEGLRTVHAKVRDFAGNESAPLSATITLDLTNPATGSINLASGNAFVGAAANVPAALTSSDATSMVAQYCITDTNVQPAGNATCWAPYATSVTTDLLPGDGPKTKYAWFKDGSGRISSPAAQDTVTLDTTAPTVSAFSIANGADYVSLLGTTANSTASDGTGSGLSQLCTGPTTNPTNCQSWAASAPINLPAGEGPKTVYAVVKDALGNTSTVMSDSITVDQTSPAITSLRINGGAPNTTVPGVNLTVGASDGYVVAEVAFSTNGGSSYGTWQAYNAVTTYPVTLSGPDGSKTVHAKVRDGAGNESAALSSSIVLDTAPPSPGTVAIAGGASHVAKPQTTADLTATDATSTVTHYCVRYTNTPPTTAGDGCWTAYAPSVSITLPSGDGPVVAYFWFKDGAGLFTTTAVTDSIVLDETPPTLSSFTIAGGAAWVKAVGTTTTQSANDAIGLFQLCTGTTSPPQNCVGYGTSLSLNLPAGDGPKTIYAQVRDFAGNNSGILSDNVGLDTVSPTVSAFTVAGGGTWTTSATVSTAVTATDPGVSGAASGVSQQALSYDGTTFGPWVSLNTAGSLPTGDGAKTVTVKVRDQAGNESAVAADGVTLDTTDPTGTVTIEAGATYTNKTPSFSVAFTSADATSGVKRWCLSNSATTPTTADTCWSSPASPQSSWTYAPAGEGTKNVYLHIEDNAGQVTNSSAVFDSIVVDTTPPSTPTGLVRNSSGHRTANVSWSASSDGSSGVVGYKLGIGASGSGPFDYDNTATAGTTRTVTGLQNLRYHYFSVKAVDGAGNESAAYPGGGDPAVWAYPAFPFTPYQREPTSLDFTSVAMFEITGSQTYPRDGIAVGEAGTVFTTGNEWSTVARRDALRDSDWFDVSIDGADGTGNYATVVGSGGAISYSPDRGVSWWDAVSPTTNTLYSHSWAGSTGSIPNITSHYVAVGANGTIVHAGVFGILVAGSKQDRVYATETSGVTAHLRAVARCSGGTLSSDPDVVAVGDNGTILTSTDNGNSWTKITLSATYASMNLRAVAGVPGTKTMYAAGVPYSASPTTSLLRSSNCGQTWTALTGYTNIDTLEVNDLSVVDSTNIWLGGNAVGSALERVAKYNGASTVSVATLPSTFSKVNGISAQDATHVYIASTLGNIGYTTDGTSWTNQATGTNSNLSVMDTAPTSSGYAWAAGAFNSIYYTSNSALSFTNQSITASPSVHFEGVATPSTTLSYAAGRDTNTVPAGKIYKYNSGTTSWAAETLPNSPAVPPLNDIDCQTTTNCYAVGDNKTVLKYNGTSWTYDLSPGGATQLNSVAMYPTGSGRIVIVGASGRVRRYDATTWLESTVVGTITPTLVSVAVKRDNSGVVIAGSSSNKVYVSTDHGANFTERTLPIGSNVIEVAHGTGTTWYAATSSTYALKSEDDGSTWAQMVLNVPSGTALWGMAVAKSTPATVYILGQSGMILRSTTSGE